MLPTLATLMIASFLAPSCNRDTSSESESQNSHLKSSSLAPPLNAVLLSDQLIHDFPLLPLIEKRLWQTLLDQEKQAADSSATDEDRQQAEQQIQRLSEQLQSLHPFSQNKNTITLGQISYHRESGRIEFMARVNNLETQRKGDQEGIEVIVCTPNGRTHESLFVSDVRPLHLEILLHLAGYSKLENASQFQILISIPTHDLIRVDELLVAQHGSTLPPSMLWEFSGSSFKNLYQPDLTGDLIISWHAHDSALISHDPKIASHETRLLATPHPALKPDMVVKIILAPDYLEPDQKTPRHPSLNQTQNWRP